MTKAGVQEFRKALFVGGAITMLIWAIMVFTGHPYLFWVGMLVGGGFGYFFYRFDVVKVKASVAWKYAKSKSKRYAGKAWNLFWEIFRYHPYSHCLIAMLLLSVLVSAPYASLLTTDLTGKSEIKDISSFKILFCATIILSLLVWMFQVVSLQLFSIHFQLKIPGIQEEPSHFADIPCTYKNCFYFWLFSLVWSFWRMVRVVSIVLKAFFFFFSRDIWIGLGYTIVFFCRFAWHLIVLVHCEERLMILVDGPLGASLVAFFTLYYWQAPVLYLPFLGLAGGLSAIALGEFNRLVVLRKWLWPWVSADLKLRFENR